MQYPDEFGVERRQTELKPITVTRPYLPPLDEFIPYLREIWDSRVLTNGGPFHQRLETELIRYLEVPNISLFTNGTIALLTALQALEIKGEVITTPYSFVATSHALLWNGIKPVFVDIDPNTLNLDPKLIEKAITSRTTAIMPVHCYGRPCDIDEIEKIAKRNGLKVIYDAAHAFGVQCHCGSLLNHGDLSVLSFHATKVFNTFEGGAVISKNEAVKQRIDHLKNFGFQDEVTVIASGINGKMSEFNAALGLLQIKYVDSAIKAREAVYLRYWDQLSHIRGIECVGGKWVEGNNFAYFPIKITEENALTRDDVFEKLRERKIMARRYFYPLISDFPMYRDFPSSAASNLPVAKKAASQILCLPIYPGLADDQIDMIVQILSA